jgi:hypothetical protein
MISHPIELLDKKGINNKRSGDLARLERVDPRH